jgi:thiol-disulfide isomerase/thioredoxin
MKTSYSFMALILIMPICIGYAYQSKKHWEQYHADKPAVIQIESPPVESPPVVKTEPEPIAEEIMTQPMSYQESLQIAQRTGKKVLLYFSGERFCEPCRRMKSTFADPSVQQSLRNYIFYKIDVEGSEAIIGRQKGVVGVPTYMIVSSEDVVLKTGKGYKNSISFLQWLSVTQTIADDNPIYRYQPYKGVGKSYWCEKCAIWHYDHPVAIKTMNAVQWVTSPRYRQYIKQQKTYFQDCI